MDIRYIEQAIEMFYRFCDLHPDLCPHNMHWIFTRTLKDGKEEMHYKCGICGHEDIIVKESK